jgi:hypothetical protein
VAAVGQADVARPPPIMPTIIGSTTVSVNSIATAASTALPPAASISSAGRRGQRMIGHRHAGGPVRRPLLAGELRARALAPCRLGHPCPR